MGKDNYLGFVKHILEDELSLGSINLEGDMAIRDVGIDSISLMALLVYIENEYNVCMDEIFMCYQEQITFSDIINLLEEGIGKSE